MSKLAEDLRQDLNFCKSLAFLVQCSTHAGTSLLDQNEEWANLAYSSARMSQRAEYIRAASVEDHNSDRSTPAADVDPTVWLFVSWNLKKPSYVFGTASNSDIVLPKEKQVSRKHFTIYLGQHGTWMIRNLSQFGMWVNGELLGIRQGPGEFYTQAALIPDEPNEIRAGSFECTVHAIKSFEQKMETEDPDAIGSSLLDFEFQSEGSRTSIGSSSLLLQLQSFPVEDYIVVRTSPIPSQADEENVFLARHRRTGQRFIAKCYGLKDERNVGLQYNMMLALKVRDSAR